MCKFLLRVDKPGFHPGGTALRGEAMTPSDRCQLKPKKDNFGRRHDVLRWIYSGGDAITVAHPCSGNCPLKVPADIGGFDCAHTGPCPACRRIARQLFPGPVVCKECKTEFELCLINLDT